MLSLTLTAGYAIRALSCVDRRQRRLAQNIAGQSGVPKPYLSKILHALARAGVLHAKRGYCGGFVLARPAEEISLYEIVVAVDGPEWLNRCLLGLDRCSDERACPMHEFWRRQREILSERLQTLSLRDIADFERRREEALNGQPQTTELRLSNGVPAAETSLGDAPPTPANGNGETGSAPRAKKRPRRPASAASAAGEKMQRSPK